MKMVLISVYDAATESFGVPESVPHSRAAVRGFSDAIKNDKTNYHKHPEDYELFELGTYETEGAVFDLHDKPVRLIRGLDVGG